MESAALHGKKKKSLSKETRWTLIGLAFASPWIIGFITFTAYPFFVSFYYSLTSYDLINSPKWVGFDNYAQIFKDSYFYKAIQNTFFMAAIAVPINLFASLIIALVLNLKVKGIAIYRTIYYLPAVIPAVAGAMLWSWLLNPEYGIIDIVLRAVGLPDPAWLSDPQFTKPSLILMGLWGAGAGAIIYLAALQGIPQHYYEAASLDGANLWQKFRYITLPALSPVTLFQLIMGLIGAFQIFTESFILMGDSMGGPDQSMLFYAVYLYQQAFISLKMGYASALAWVLFVIVILVTIGIFKSSMRWVYYGGD
ncbi:spermidine/putrescine ABC transporter permease [Bacillus sp. SA1-12]|uniref:carbohydrate ABC transporter permease n=1 Tax=Bacillus sp. SA1-12 TaxID=1455638 RepID=UPI00062540BE|nr:sugar ABC transporter permease [Bacillus sp. SA1-12]KKI92096.1 spermidine/putrescine ABC transporter permease [Bacillus sp. SA1-12]